MNVLIVCAVLFAIGYFIFKDYQIKELQNQLKRQKDENNFLKNTIIKYQNFVSDLNEDFFKKAALLDLDCRNGLPLKNPHNDYLYGDYTVFISNRGKKFHKKRGCSDAYYPIDRFSAISKKYEPCSKCCAKNSESEDVVNLTQFISDYDSVKALETYDFHAPKTLPAPMECGKTSDKNTLPTKKTSNIFYTVLISLGIIGALVFAGNGLYAYGQNIGYSSGYENGQNDGYEDGYNEGYTAGNDEGYREGKNAGYREGLSNGEDEGYRNGYKNGYFDGLGDEPYQNNAASTQYQYAENLYVLNTSTKKIHDPDCGSVDLIADKNYSTWWGESAQDCINAHPGYSRCQKCNPY